MKLSFRNCNFIALILLWRNVKLWGRTIKNVKQNITYFHIVLEQDYRNHVAVSAWERHAYARVTISRNDEVQTRLHVEH